MKVNRHAKIVELINRYHIEKQEVQGYQGSETYEGADRRWKTEICGASDDGDRDE